MVSTPATSQHRAASPTQTPRLTAPIGGTPVDGSAATFTWEEVSSALNYRLHVAADAGFEHVVCTLETGPTTLLTLLDMLPRDGSVFHWRVQALTPVGWQPWSSVEHFKAQTHQHEIAVRTKQEATVKQGTQPSAATQPGTPAKTVTGGVTYQRGHTSKTTMALFLVMMIVTFAATFASVAYIVFSSR